MVLIMMITGAKCLIVMCNYSTHQPWLIVVVLNDEDDDGDSNKIQVNMRKSQSLSVMLILLINAATLMNGLIWETKHRKPCFFHVFFMFCFLKVGTRFNHKFLGFDMPVNQTQGHPLVHTCWSLICLFQLDKPVGPQKTRLCEADLIGFGGSVVSNTTRRMEKKNTAGVLFLLSWCWGSCWNLLIIAWGLSQIKGTASYRFPKCPASSACGSSSITEIKPRHEVPTNNDIICITTYTYILYIYIIYTHQKISWYQSNLAPTQPFFRWSGDSIVTGSSAGELVICPLERLWNLPPAASGTSTSARLGEQSQPQERNTNILQIYEYIIYI